MWGCFSALSNILCTLQSKAHRNRRVDPAHDLPVDPAHALAQPPLIKRADLFEQHHRVARQTAVQRRKRDMGRQLRLIRL